MTWSMAKIWRRLAATFWQVLSIPSTGLITFDNKAGLKIKRAISWLPKQAFVKQMKQLHRGTLEYVSCTHANEKAIMKLMNAVGVQIRGTWNIASSFAVSSCSLQCGLWRSFLISMPYPGNGRTNHQVHPRNNYGRVRLSPKIDLGSLCLFQETAALISWVVIPIMSFFFNCFCTNFHLRAWRAWLWANRRSIIQTFSGFRTVKMNVFLFSLSICLEHWRLHLF